MTAWTRGALIGLLIVAGALLALEGSIRLYARSVGSRAAARYGGDRVTGLTSLVNCAQCPLQERDMAVWALGEFRDRRALPALQAHYTGRKCDHAAELCQYELRKAIRKIGRPR